jgi:DNA-binding NarL/FixJ family response regulator
MKVLIVDDHQIMIDGLLALLSPDKTISVTGIAKNGRQALTILEGERADIVLTDISMPEMDGITLTREIKKKYPDMKIIALSMHGDSSHISDMLDAGVSGYIYKNVSNDELIKALKKVYEGGVYYSDEIAATIMQSLHDHAKKKAEEEKVNLTSREKQIIQLIAKEYSNARIAGELFISERTVETHRKNIYTKTSTSSIVGLIKWAYENKVI